MRTPLILLLPFAAMAISCAVEIAYLRIYVERGFPIGRIVVANVISALLLALVPSIAEIISLVRPEWAWKLWDLTGRLALAAMFVSAVVLIGAWVLPYRRDESRSPSSDDPSALNAASGEASEEPQLASSK